MGGGSRREKGAEGSQFSSLTTGQPGDQPAGAVTTLNWIEVRVPLGASGSSGETWQVQPLSIT